MLKLKQALYGLKISPKKWNERFNKVMEGVGMQRDSAGPCCCCWKDGKDFVTLISYEDKRHSRDGDQNEIIEPVEKAMYKNFEMSYLGEPKKDLGIWIERNQEQKVMILHRIVVGALSSTVGKERKAITPMVVGTTEETEGDMFTSESLMGYEKMSFRELLVVGKLLSLTNATRPDIAFAVKVLTRRQTNPQLGDWTKVECLLDFLRRTASKGLIYKGEGKNRIECYVDADFASDRKNRKSVTGFNALW